MILGLLGNAGVGKDTVAAMLAHQHMVKFNGVWTRIREAPLQVYDRHEAATHASEGVQLAFADPLKVLCQTVYDFSKEQLWGPSSRRNAADHRYRREHERHEIAAGACQNCGLTFDEALVTPKCSSYLTPREALQRLGTEWGRACWPDTWVRLTLASAEELIANSRMRRAYAPAAAHVVISDVRYANEAQAIRSAGGVVLRIRRSSAGQVRAHSSEEEQTSLPDGLISYTIRNEGTIADLEREVHEVFKHTARMRARR